MYTICIFEGRKPKPINRDLRSTQYLLILLHSKQTCISIITNCEYRHQTLIINWQVLSHKDHLPSIELRNMLNPGWQLNRNHHIYHNQYWPATEEVKQGQFSKFYSRQDGHVKSSSSLKEWSHKDSPLCLNGSIQQAQIKVLLTNCPHSLATST